MIPPAGSDSGTKRLLRRCLSWRVLVPALVAMSFPAVYLAAVAAADPLLTERADPKPVDTIVVLGGDGPARASKAAALWREGIARHIVVAGDGDCAYIREAMVEAGVRPAAVVIECRSRNTWENAANAAPFLVDAGTRSAALVTSWFHTVRALAVFRAFCPGIDWIAVPTEPPRSVLATAFGHYGLSVAQEYVKAVGYRLRGFLYPPGDPSPGASCVEGGQDT